MTLALINGTWCPASDPYFEPLLQSGQFYDQWTLDQTLPHVKQRRAVPGYRRPYRHLDRTAGARIRVGGRVRA